MSRAAQVREDFYNLAESIETRALGLGTGASWESGVCKPWSTSARPKQVVDWEAKWFLWLWLCGRGFGKTWSLFGNATDRWKSGAWRRTALVAPTQDDAHKLVQEDDESGLLAMCYAEGLSARIKPGTGKLVVEVGDGTRQRVYLYSAEKPGRLRNKQHDSAIMDEVREMVGLEAVYSNLVFGLRIGDDPRILAGSTPPGVVGARKTGAAIQAANREFVRGVLRGGKYVRREHGQPPPLMSRESTVVVFGSSDENRENVSPTFEEHAIAPYRGTRIGKQEVQGLFVDEIEGSILTLEDIESHRVGESERPDLDVIGVAVDPQGRAGKPENSDTGIIGGGRGWPDGFTADGEPHGKAHAYILADDSGSFKPLGWAQRCVGTMTKIDADWLLGEINHGGDLVEANVTSFDDSIRFRMVTASRGKHVRIAPGLSLVQQGRVHHVGTSDAAKAAFEILEDQLTQFTDDGWQGTGSPDHADAWAYLVSELLLGDLRAGYALAF